MHQIGHSGLLAFVGLLISRQDGRWSGSGRSTDTQALTCGRVHSQRESNHVKAILDSDPKGTSAGALHSDASGVPLAQWCLAEYLDWYRCTYMGDQSQPDLRFDTFFSPAANSLALQSPFPSFCLPVVIRLLFAGGAGDSPIDGRCILFLDADCAAQPESFFSRRCTDSI